MENARPPLINPMFPPKLKVNEHSVRVIWYRTSGTSWCYNTVENAIAICMESSGTGQVHGATVENAIAICMMQQQEERCSLSLSLIEEHPTNKYC